MYSSGYIAKAACRGHRPAPLVPFSGFQRAHLIARMVKDRTVVRVIVAPSGYGKTCLALDYAETVFDWAHVFWLNGQSPCFIRDLDLHSIASAVLEADEKASLVVVDDVPQLDAARIEALSREIDALLDCGCEVVMTCVPSCGSLGAIQVDRLRIGPDDLLLTDAELDSIRPFDERNRLPSPLLPPARRIAALCWGGTGEERAAFAAGCFSEDLPADMLLVIGSVLVLRSGPISDLSGLGVADVRQLAGELSAYPHLGFDFTSGRFEAPPLAIGDLHRPLKRRLPAMVARSRFEHADDLVDAWASVLMRRELGAERACDVVRLLLTADLRFEWLAGHERELVRFGCFLPVANLIKSLRSAKSEGRPLARSLEALCYQLLGDDERAIVSAKSAAFRGKGEGASRIEGQLVIARLASGELRDRAVAALAEVAGEWAGVPLSAAPWWVHLARAWVEREKGLAALVAFWGELRSAGACDEVLCRAASWSFGLLASLLKAGGAAGAPAAVDDAGIAAMQLYVREQLEGAFGMTVDFYAASAGLSMEEAHREGMDFAQGPLGTSVLLALRRVEVMVMAQRSSYERDRRKELAVVRDWEDEQLQEFGEERPVPLLEVRLFGRFSVSVGSREVDPAHFNRKQVRLLLALLAVARGREVSRDSLAEQMWPNSSEELARRNFYSAWAKLRRALRLPDGTCPYLERHNRGCRLNDHYVRSDIARLGDICRELMFEPANHQRWLDLYAEIDRDFSCELLPAEGAGTSLDQVRAEWRERLVDALVAAAGRLVDDGQPQTGIWFARAAAERDETREDAYVALMRAQVAADQRTAAMMTYLKCRRVLSECLGIDPSAEMSALYESLLGNGS